MTIQEMYLSINFRMDIETILAQVEKIVTDIIDEISISYFYFFTIKRAKQ